VRLAKIVGVGHAAVSHWETGRSTPSIEVQRLLYGLLEPDARLETKGIQIDDSREYPKSRGSGDIRENIRQYNRVMAGLESNTPPSQKQRLKPACKSVEKGNLASCGSRPTVSRQESGWVRPSWSILNHLLPVAFGLPASWSEQLLKAMDNRTLSELGLSDSVWEALSRQSVFKEDPLTDPLHWTLEYVSTLFLDESHFSSFLTAARCLMTGTDADGWSGPSTISTTPILGSGFHSQLANLPSSALHWPKPLTYAAKIPGLGSVLDVSEVSEAHLIEEVGLSLKTLAMIGSFWNWREEFRAVCSELDVLVAADSVQEFVLSSLGVSIDSNFGKKARRSARDAQVVVRRFGLDGQRPGKLREIGDKLGLTRERVRQLVVQKQDKVLGSLGSFLSPLFWVCGSVVDSQSGAVKLGRLVSELNQTFGWRVPMTTDYVERLLGFAKDLEITNGYVSRAGLQCRNCESAAGMLCDLVNDLGTVTMSQALNALGRYCDEFGPKIECRAISPSSGLLRVILDSNEDSAGHPYCEGQSLYSEEEWTVRSGPISAGCEILLKRSEQAMHFSAVFEELSQRRSGPPGNPQYVYSSLQNNPRIISWDRGSFIHVENIDFDYYVVKQIEDAVEQRLLDLPGPQMLSVSGIFESFKPELKSMRVPSELGLYSLLRMSDDPRFVLPRYPQVYLAESFDGRIPLPEAVDQILRDAGGPLPYKELERIVVCQMGYKKYQFSILVSSLSNCIRVEKWGFLHVDLLPFGAADLMPVVDCARGLAAQNGHVSVARVLEDRMVDCILLDIRSPITLFYSLKHFFSDVLDLRSYPTVGTRPQGDDETRPIGILESVVKFLASCPGDCPWEKLTEHFVEKLRYKETTVYNVVQRPEVYRYLPNSLVHRHVIGLTDRLILEVQRCAGQWFRRAVSTGDPYASIRRMLDAKKLPPLSGGLVWTPQLVSHVLSRSGDYRVLGSSRDAFVATENEHGIKDFEDLAAILLVRDHAGGTALSTFEEDLRSKGIVAKTLTSFMFPRGKLTIDGLEIVVAPGDRG